MEPLNKELVDQSAQENIDRILEIIKEKCEKTPSGKIRGYLLLGDTQDVLSREEVRKIQVRRKDEEIPARFGSSVCGESNSEKCVLVGIMLSYIIHYKLMDELIKYPFKKLRLTYADMQEYLYDETKFWKYKKTGYVIPFLKVNIEW